MSALDIPEDVSCGAKKYKMFARGMDIVVNDFSKYFFPKIKVELRGKKIGF